ncbi:LysR family transcriptional regulator [Meridianimarinicoccus aquatilis]|uniref:LysR family transcriptional regulator n=1 Tax=Meridianimarinicoccus aquatilis TaxID=2552766 RepID=A0A4R6ASK0_9RHOB|nr:LysR family transcriptional regulator [Fluviibacterium aquatile]QIE41159.1 LysR family transcriptional regulator [Rhodobacteraceae bacterium SC52]TDL84803.1 LysR family transcriptional regulator [Fluviibacterium aquatile]
MIAKLEMFIALARERHFGRAADSLGITQPTLSTGIKQLEAHLGVKLVQRGSRFGGLTPEGQHTLLAARQIVGDARRLRDEMRATRLGLSGKVRLAVIPTALTWASRLATSFNRQNPNVEFSILSRSSHEVLTMIETLEADIGLSYLDNEPLGRVTNVGLYRETYTLVCHETHPLAARARANWADLADVQLCLLTPDMQNRRIINRNFMEAGVTPLSPIESNSTVVLVSNVVAGPWATILPTDMAAFLAAGQPLRVLPLDGGVPAHQVGLVAPHQEPQTPVLQALMTHGRDMAID